MALWGFAPLVLGIFGLFLGSFLNSVVFRLEQQESLSGRSYCPKCRKKLAWFELVPVLSFVFQGGRCRGCQEKISLFYPIGELAVGASFFLVSRALFQNFEFTYLLTSQPFVASVFLSSFLFYTAVLFIISAFDFRNYLIPEIVFFVGMAGAIIFSVFLYMSDAFTDFSFLGAYFTLTFPSQNFFLSKILGALLIGGFFFLLWAFSKGKAMGFGDVEVGLLVGYIFGFYDGLLTMMLTFLLGGMSGLALLIFRRKGLKSHLPYAPFLGFAFLLTIVSGRILLERYFSLFG